MTIDEWEWGDSDINIEVHGSLLDWSRKPEGLINKTIPLAHPNLGEIGVLNLHYMREPKSIKVSVGNRLETMKVRAGQQLRASQSAQHISALLTRCDVPECVTRVTLSCSDFTALYSIELKVTHRALLVIFDCDVLFQRRCSLKAVDPLESLQQHRLPQLKCCVRSFPTPRLISQCKALFVSAPEHLKAAKSLIARLKKHLSIAVPLLVLDLTKLGGQLTPFTALFQLTSAPSNHSDSLTHEELERYLKQDLQSERHKLQYYYGEAWEHQQALALIAQLIGPEDLYDVIKGAKPSLPTFVTVARINHLGFYGYSDDAERSHRLSRDRVSAMFDLLTLCFSSAVLYREPYCLGLRALIAQSIFSNAHRLSFISYLKIFCGKPLHELDQAVSKRSVQAFHEYDDQDLSPFDQLVRRPAFEIDLQDEERPINPLICPESLEDEARELRSLSSLIITLGLLIVEGEQPLKWTSRVNLSRSSGMSLKDALASAQRRGRAYSSPPPRPSVRGARSQRLAHARHSKLRGQERSLQAPLLHWVAGLLDYASQVELARGLASLTHALFYLKWETLTRELLCLTRLVTEGFPEDQLHGATLSLLPEWEEPTARSERVALRSQAWRAGGELSLAARAPLTVNHQSEEHPFILHARLDSIELEVSRDMSRFLETITQLITANEAPTKHHHQAV